MACAGRDSRRSSDFSSPLSDRRDVLAAANEWLSLIPNNVTIPEDARKRIGLFETADEIRGYLKTKISPALDSLVEKYYEGINFADGGDGGNQPESILG